MKVTRILKNQFLFLNKIKHNDMKGKKNPEFLQHCVKKWTVQSFRSLTILILR